MYRLLLLLLSSQCVAAHCVACHATVRCCPSCHPLRRCAVLPVVSPLSGCVLGRGVLPMSLPPCCPLRVGPWCVARIAAAATLPVVSPSSACQATVCYPRRRRRRAACCVAIEWLCVGPRCAAHIVTAAALPVVSPSSACQATV